MTSDSLEEKGYCEVQGKRSRLEFDNEKLATILGVPGKNGICEYIKEVWEESKYTKPLEITLQRKRRKVKMKEIKLILTREAAIDEATAEGESWSGRSSMMPRKMLKALRNRSMRFQQMLHPASAQQKDKGIAESTLGLTAEMPNFRSSSAT
ncbi:hypothetical protein Dimus_023306 [Dionaea muscipula]